MRKTIALLGIIALAVPVAQAAQIVNYGWEDGVGTILGSYGNIANPANVTTGSDPGTNNQSPSHVPALVVTPHGGSRMLEIMEDPHDGTPQAYVAYIENLSEGDQVTVGFYGWDSTPDTSPAMRIWGHYALNGDVNSYDGSASGNGTYTTGPETGAWSYVDYTWTVEAGKEALVIEARLYSTPSTSTTNSTTYWIDDLSVTAPDGATVTVPVPEPMTLTLLGVGGICTFIRHRRMKK